MQVAIAMLWAPVFKSSMQPTCPPPAAHMCTLDEPLHSPSVEITELPGGHVACGDEYQ